MKKIIAALLGMIGALVGWQAVMAFLGLGLIFNGIQAGLSLIAFAVAFFIVGIDLVIPRD